MRATIIVAFVWFLALRAASQDLPKPQTQARCKFSDGSTITVAYSSEHKNYRLATDESLVTVRGMSVPAGAYSVFPARDAHNNWTLTMRKQNEKGRSSELPPVPMSVAIPALPVGNLTVSFDETGGSCMMHWASEKSNLVLSLEFTEKNTDLPVMK
jgi:hypothetical protein